MKISLTGLKEMISEAVRAKMNEGPRQVSIEMVLNHEDIKEPTVDSICQDLSASLGLDFNEIHGSVERGYDKMVQSIVVDLDIRSPQSPSGETPTAIRQGVVRRNIK